MPKYLLQVVITSLLWVMNCTSDSDPNPEVDDGPIPISEEAFAFPGAEGFGNRVTGGRGGKILFVTNLNDSGPGSFRTAVNASGARIILFKVSGTISLITPVTITTDHLTIAGQTAPGDGVTIRNYPVFVNGDNIIIRFLHFRMGDAGEAEGDALWGRYHKDIILDHCSMSWSTDECSSFYGNENFTMQWCILSESLRNSVHEKGTHGYGGIWGGKNASFHHNLLAHHNNRNPRFDHPGVYSNVDVAASMRGTVDFRNNVIYNWRTDASYGGEAGTFNMVANYYKPGPATTNARRFLNAYKQATSGSPVYGYGEFYIANNVIDGEDDITGDNWIGVVAKDGSTSDKEALKLATPLPFGDFNTSHTATQAYEVVLNHAGASFNRDAVDARIVNNVRNGTFTNPGSNGSTLGIIDSQEDVGGWPELHSLEPPSDTDEDGMPDEWELTMKLDPKVNNANGRDLSTAYDNIEIYINSLVKDITNAQNE
jgi:hypothetical protein